MKAIRDVVSGLFIAILMIDGSLHLLGWFMLSATIIPLSDAMIVLSHGGNKGVGLRNSRRDRWSNANNQRSSVVELSRASPVRRSACVQVFGRRDDETDHTVMRPATQKAPRHEVAGCWELAGSEPPSRPIRQRAH